MKGTTTIHDTGNSQQFVLQVGEFENVCFPVHVKQARQNLTGVIQSCHRIAGLELGKNDEHSDNVDDFCHRVYIDL